MTRTNKTKEIKAILEGTAFDVKQRGGKYIFERTFNDDKFVPDFQIVYGFESAKEWALSVKNLYKVED